MLHNTYKLVHFLYSAVDTYIHSCLATISLAIKRKNFAFVQLPALQLIFSATWVVNFSLENHCLTFTLVGTAT